MDKLRKNKHMFHLIALGAKPLWGRVIKAAVRGHPVVVHYHALESAQRLPRTNHLHLVVIEAACTDSNMSRSLAAIHQKYPGVPMLSLLLPGGNVKSIDRCTHLKDHLCMDPDRYCPPRDAKKCRKNMNLRTLGDKIFASITEHYGKDWRTALATTDHDSLVHQRLTTLARQFGVTPACMSRRFHEIYHCGFREYCIRYRMARAAEMIRDPTLSIKEIAFDIGYTCPSDLTRAFKGYYGMSPRDYRTRKQKPRT